MEPRVVSCLSATQLVFTTAIILACALGGVFKPTKRGEAGQQQKITI